MDAVHFFEALRLAVYAPENKALYLLAVICGLMVLDFITGTVAAWVNPTIAFKSRIGINGILRKMCSILVLIACIPVAPLIPADAGVTALIVLYLGYMLMEFSSILENLAKMGVDIKFFSAFVERLKGKEDKHE